jgi:hypothetical protein
MKTRALLAMLAVAGLTVSAAAADLDLIVNDKRLSQPKVVTPIRPRLKSRHIVDSQHSASWPCLSQNFRTYLSKLYV